MNELRLGLRQSLFIAGTDTGVGKTWVALQLLRALADSGIKAAAMKPVAAGADLTPAGLRNDDAKVLQQAAGVDLPYELVNPICLAAATSPHLAASRAGVRIDIAPIKAAFDQIRLLSDVIIVEGAGGWFAPIGEPKHPGETGPTLEDIALALGLPVLLVVGIRLGCINHAVLTAAAIQRSGLPWVGWIANPIDPEFPDHEDYVGSLRARLPAPLLSIPPSP